jgi:hypothetical protein
MEHRQFRQCGNVCSLLCAWCECSNPSGVASCCRRLCCIRLHSSTKSNQSRDGLARFQSLLYSCSYVVLGRCGCCPLADCHLYLLAETVGFERVALRWRKSRVASDSDFDRRPRPPLRHRPPVAEAAPLRFRFCKPTHRASVPCHSFNKWWAVVQDQPIDGRYVQYVIITVLLNTFKYMNPTLKAIQCTTSLLLLFCHC